MSDPRPPGTGPAIFVGTAGWSIPKADQEAFAPGGSHLVRYASRFDGVEINSSFYRPHRVVTYQRWADDVPDRFRFAVKMPKAITHEGRLVDRDGNQVEGFQVHLGGAVGQQANFGRKLRAHKVASVDLDDYVSALVTNYLADREDGETFTTWVLSADETLVRGDKVLEVVEL